MSVYQIKDPTNWSPTNAVRCPDLELYEKACNWAREQGPAIPVGVKWKNVSTRLPLSTPAQAWIDQAVVKTFGSLLEPGNPYESTMIPGMDAYNIVLYLVMEV